MSYFLNLSTAWTDLNQYLKRLLCNFYTYFLHLNIIWRDLNPITDNYYMYFHVFLHVYILHVNFIIKIYM